MKTTLALCLLVLLVSACAPNKQSAPFNIVPPEETQPSNSGTLPKPDTLPENSNGVRGQALIGPTCPVVRVDNPCPDQPYQASLVVLSPNGQEVTRFETDAEGKFQILLPPGDYILHANLAAGRFLPSAEDVPFTVLPNEFTEVVINFDSGIR